MARSIRSSVALAAITADSTAKEQGHRSLARSIQRRPGLAAILMIAGRSFWHRLTLRRAGGSGGDAQRPPQLE
jgi:hypothetical protein